MIEKTLGNTLRRRCFPVPLLAVLLLIDGGDISADPTEPPPMQGSGRAAVAEETWMGVVAASPVGAAVSLRTPSREYVVSGPLSKHLVKEVGKEWAIVGRLLNEGEIEAVKAYPLSGKVGS